MADVHRLRDGDPPIVAMPVDSSTVIEVGDLLFLDTDDVKPASDQADAGTEADNKTTFADNFAGVAMTASASGETADVSVAVPDGRAVFEFAIASGTAEPFTLVSVEADATTAGAAGDQNVESTTTNAEAIGYIAKRYGSATTSVEVILFDIMLSRLSAL